jgi:hypothetical protein
VDLLAEEGLAKLRNDTSKIRVLAEGEGLAVIGEPSASSTAV